MSPASPGVAPKGLKSTGTAEFNKVWSYLGTPCISLPLLEGENNLPLGVQLIGDKYDDHDFFGVANWLEKECQNKMNKITTIIGLSFAVFFLIGLATTLTRSMMIGFLDVLPVYFLMGAAIIMMIYEAFFDKD